MSCGSRGWPTPAMQVVRNDIIMQMVIPWRLMMRVSAQAGNGASKIQRDLQWWGTGPGEMQ